MGGPCHRRKSGKNTWQAYAAQPPTPCWPMAASASHAPPITRMEHGINVRYICPPPACHESRVNSFSLLPSKLTSVSRHAPNPIPLPRFLGVIYSLSASRSPQAEHHIGSYTGTPTRCRNGLALCLCFFFCCCVVWKSCSMMRAQDITIPVRMCTNFNFFCPRVGRSGLAKGVFSCVEQVRKSTSLSLANFDDNFR